ncbi:MAG: YheV family putative zinc ribbon protein [Endozoicomonas sp. (ex Botrylloides leachii)]|nr:YheV family putative zinc ribbon protein [Endozoicomonas sp. (ex Botrylloides leachii)]
MSVKRFIAGAVCPSCGAMDTIRTFIHAGQEHRECVECHYVDAMSFEPTLQGALPEARIAREERVTAKGVELVRILD